MAFGQFKLMTVQVANPRAEAQTIGALFEWTNERHTGFFKDDGAELAKIAGVDANVNLSASAVRALFHLYAEQARIKGNRAIEISERQHRVVDAEAEIIDGDFFVHKTLHDVFEMLSTNPILQIKMRSRDRLRF